MKLFILLFSFFSVINFSAQTGVKTTESVSIFRLRKFAERGNSRYISEFKTKTIRGANSPDDISDGFEKKLAESGYKRSAISPEEIRAVKELLSTYKFGFSKTETACLPVFRDILVYKVGGKITKIIKICISCYQNQVISPEKTTGLLIPWDDYEQLEEIFQP